LIKYDLEFVISIANGIPLYRDRLLDFKEYGLLNIPKDKKIKVVLLAKESNRNVKKGWPDNCHVSVNRFENELHVHKLCNYYMSKKIFNSKWYVGVDDDSTTDVGGLIETLSKYNFNNEIYLSTPYKYNVNEKGWPCDRGVCKQTATLELKILKQLGIIKNINKQWDHDWESHYISRSALMKITKNPINRKYITHRATILDGYSDHFLPYASKIAGIVPIDANYFSIPFDDVGNFSLFGGPFNHIHYLSHDYGNIKNFKKMINNL
jgi:Fringe-like